jgi:WD40 repeat protein
VRLWDASTGRELVAMRHDESIQGAAFSPDESRILSWSGNCSRGPFTCKTATVRLWDASTGRELVPAMRHERIVLGATFSRDGSRILSWSGDTVRLWDASTGRELVPAMHHEDSNRGGGALGATFSRDESRILSWGVDPCGCGMPAPAASWSPPCTTRTATGAGVSSAPRSAVTETAF